MILFGDTVEITTVSILHVCGDDPIICVRENQRYLYSPRMWRWSFFHRFLLHDWLVFSTYVEMILNFVIEGPPVGSILHVCGDDPIWWIDMQMTLSYSPRMWRWSYKNLPKTLPQVVFSTYVEMILLFFSSTSVVIGILHVCGDDPLQHIWLQSTGIVFSTYVEMIPKLSSLKKIKKSILHVCGDDPFFPMN